MARESVKTEAVEKQKETKAKEAAGKPVYKAGELAAKARQIFGTTPEVVTVALNAAGMEMATVDEAKATVKKFLEREVN